MKKSRGSRSKTRGKLSKGEFSIARSLQDFKIGEKVVVNINPAVHKGMPHPRFYGTVGEVVEKRNRAFLIKIKDKGKTKTLISKPEHLFPMREK